MNNSLFNYKTKAVAIAMVAMFSLVAIQGVVSGYYIFELGNGLESSLDEIEQLSSFNQ